MCPATVEHQGGEGRLLHRGGGQPGRAQGEGGRERGAGRPAERHTGEGGVASVLAATGVEPDSRVHVAGLERYQASGGEQQDGEEVGQEGSGEEG